ncbi:hypothetical protein ACFWAD_29010 [Rhodococcus sp. NPDC059969]|uniref:hypothetical protein n=1 Tax=Rhodococcus sp. NPDC059969 TaxID=3347018 RepID=UPI00366B0C02
MIAGDDGSPLERRAVAVRAAMALPSPTTALDEESFVEYGSGSGVHALTGLRN